MVSEPSVVPTTRAARIDSSELEARLEAATTGAPGIVFAAAWRDGKTLVRAAGSADLRSGRAIDAATPLAWFSATKLFTATAVMKLVEDGQVALDAPVSRYLPGARLARGGREATVRDLLSHTAGLPDPIPVSWVHLATERGPELDEMVRQRLGEHPKLRSTPGEKSAYSNLGYLVLGQLIERVTSLRFEAYVHTRVLAPLGCESAGFAVTGDRAMPYQRRWSLMGLASRFMLDSRFFGPTVGPYWELRPFTVDGAPYGGLGGPVGELLRLGQMMLADGMGEGGRVLSSTSVRAMITPTVTPHGRRTSVGLGWRLGECDGESFAHHLGGGGGYRSELRIVPRLGYAVAVIANETSFPTEQFTRLVVR